MLHPAGESLALVLPERRVGSAGYFYFAIAIYFVASGFFFRDRERRLIRRVTPSVTS